MENYKVLTTQRLRQIADAGVRAGFNRTISLDEAPFTLREDGLHLACMRLPFHTAFQKDLPEHHRVEVLANVEGTDEPYSFFLDIAASAYSTLPGMEAFRIDTPLAEAPTL